MKIYAIGLNAKMKNIENVVSAAISMVDLVSKSQSIELFYGGDSGEQNIATVVRALKEHFDAPVTAVQMDKYVKYVPNWVDKIEQFKSERFSGTETVDGRLEPIGALKRFLELVHHEDVHVLVCGGGKIALEEVQYFCRNGFPVHLVIAFPEDVDSDEKSIERFNACCKINDILKR